jgi:hypothetical protein
MIECIYCLNLFHIILDQFLNYSNAFLQIFLNILSLILNHVSYQLIYIQLHKSLYKIAE